MHSANVLQTPCIHCSMAPNAQHHCSSETLHELQLLRHMQVSNAAATAALPHSSLFSGHGSAAAQRQPAPSAAGPGASWGWVRLRQSCCSGLLARSAQNKCYCEQQFVTQRVNIHQRVGSVHVPTPICCSLT
eukprot:GHRQ01027793.1.p1 GENE.GHRQ01027793.1~~GHRQ01027793.1.p1  ORF type:complete len:132 (-),score=23.59 GHRQ01027793.1:596-991(-)